MIERSFFFFSFERKIERSCACLIERSTSSFFSGDRSIPWWAVGQLFFHSVLFLPGLYVRTSVWAEGIGVNCPRPNTLAPPLQRLQAVFFFLDEHENCVDNDVQTKMISTVLPNFKGAN